MRILELTDYTAGGCGVGMRVLKEAQLLANKGHEVTVFSTNHIKGSEAICPKQEKIAKVTIKRFPAKKLGGESYLHWNFSSEAVKFNPEVIIAHSYRHPHTTKALKVSKKLRCPIFLVTHAPFAREKSRTIMQNIIVKLYDQFIGKHTLNKFTKIITITQWEQVYLHNLGIKDNRIEYIPNGISEEFFIPIKKVNKNNINKIIYIGRISPIKNLEIVSYALAYPIEKGFMIKIKGPADKEYLKKLKSIVKENNLQDREIFVPESYNSIEQINELDRAGIFILPSKSEGMPQTLIEAMARGKIVIGSDNEGNKELIKNEKNGFLFKNGDAEDLVRVLNRINNLTQKEIDSLQQYARKTAEKFRWSEIIDKLEKIIGM